MHRTIRWLALGTAVFLLAACSHTNKNAPLAYVPANAPYVIANLKPIPEAVRAGMHPAGVTTMSTSMQASQLRDVAKKMDAKNEPHLAAVFRSLADSIDGKTMAQVQAEAGIDPDGMFAIYGLGLSPVVRGQLTDPAKFNAFFAKLETAYGQPMSQATLDKRNYKHVTLGKSGLQLLVTTYDKQFALALLPANATTKTLRLVLGLDQPEQSIQGTQRLSKLADTEGYGPYLVGYVDTTRLPSLIAGMQGPLLHAMVGAMGGKDATTDINKFLPASCESDLARITARVPMISFGYTKLGATEQVQQVDIHLADDIVKAFQGIGTHVPGLGKTANVPVDLAVALPVPQTRAFWMAQAEAVAAKPFTCPALTSLNKMFANLQTYLPRSAVPPFGDLRGFRLVLDKFDPAKLANMGKTNVNGVEARLLIASNNPAGLWNLAKAFVPDLANLAIKPDGKAVALPSDLTAKHAQGTPAWIAMGKTALAIGIGPSEKDNAASMLSADFGKPGALFSAHVNGQMYVAWLKSMGHSFDKYAATQGGTQPATNATVMQTMADAKARLDALANAMAKLKGMTSHGYITQGGLRITTDVRWEQQ